METVEKTRITVATKVNLPPEDVWKLWTEPDHIVHWNHASDDWQTTKAENDLRPGGRFNFRMESVKDNDGFDFSGVYNEIDPHNYIEYTMDDGRKVQVEFFHREDGTVITEAFESEQEHTIDLQREGWQAILDNFRSYAETPDDTEMLHFETEINCSPEIVYKTMLDKERFKDWTSDFNSTSRFEGTWEKGSKMRFLATNKDGTTGGMISIVRENIPNQLVSIEYIGIMQNDEEITSGPEVNRWKGSESYTFTPMSGRTLLFIDMECNKEFKSYFEETYPKALEKLRIICESEAKG